MPAMDITDEHQTACELNGGNPFDYLTELQKHANELSAHPADGTPAANSFIADSFV